jgi:hypothetical protein
VRVEFQATERFAWLSRVVAPVAIEEDALGDADRRALERLIKGARFFDLPAQLPAARGGTQGTCRITIEHLGRRHSVHVHEPVPGPALRKLIDRIRAIATSSARRTNLQSVHRPHTTAVGRDDDHVVSRMDLKI